jgi:energy-coupling factor transporter ATP-binding protein EcfA2
MSESIELALVRIFNSEKTAVGAGLLVGEKQIVTCAHVINSALGRPKDAKDTPSDGVNLDFPLVAGTRDEVLTAIVAHWQPMEPDEVGDIAVLELSDPTPECAQPVRLRLIEDDLWGHKASVCGFRAGYAQGIWVESELRGGVGGGLLQMDGVHLSGYRVEWGFSGAPVRDLKLDAVVGIVAQADYEAKTAFIIPTRTLLAECPSLAVTLPSPTTVMEGYVFISYSREDKVLVGRLQADLQYNGINVWIDHADLRAGTRDWEQAVRDALRNARAVVLVATPNSRRSNPVKGELAIAEMYERTIIPIWAGGDKWPDSIELDRILMQYIDARGGAYETAIMRLVTELNNIHVPMKHPKLTREPDFEPRNPYKGLLAFREEDKGDFCGRKDLIEELVEALRKRVDNNRLLAVIGPSGSGKSSVVMAGLLPRLREGAIPGSESWIFLDPTVPGTSPLQNLCTPLARVLPHKSNTIIREDLDNPEGCGLHLLGRQIVHDTDQRVVLFIDQFEELFTQSKGEDERRQFITILTTAAQEPNGPIMIVLTLRADFYDRPMEYPALYSLLQPHQSVPPMSLEELREVIEKPAALPDVKVTFEEQLVGDLLFEVRDQVGGLPLLQFTLDQLFQKRDHHTLTLAAYCEIEGLRGALARHAEKIFKDLPTDEHRELARELFLRLIEPGESEQDTTPRRVELAGFDFADEARTNILREVIEVFVDGRLLTAGKTAKNATIEMAHAALITHWTRLEEWVNNDRDKLQLRRQLERDVERWEEENRSSAFLAPVVVMERAKAQLKLENLNELERAYIAASEQKLQAQRDKELSIAKNLARQQATAQILWRFTATSFAFILGLWAVILNEAEPDPTNSAWLWRTLFGLSIPYALLFAFSITIGIEFGLAVRQRDRDLHWRIILGILAVTSAMLWFCFTFFGLLVRNETVGDIVVPLTVPAVMLAVGYVLPSTLAWSIWGRLIVAVIGMVGTLIISMELVEYGALVRPSTHNLAFVLAVFGLCAIFPFAWEIREYCIDRRSSKGKV